MFRLNSLGTLIIGVLVLVIVITVVVYIIIRRHRTQMRLQSQRYINTHMSPSEIITHADRVYLTRGWSLKARNEASSIYERRIYGNIGATILLVCLTVIGGILYYFLSGRTDVTVITLRPQSNDVATVYFDTSGCRKKRSLDCEDALATVLSTTLPFVPQAT